MTVKALVVASAKLTGMPTNILTRTEHHAPCSSWPLLASILNIGHQHCGAPGMIIAELFRLLLAPVLLSGAVIASTIKPVLTAIFCHWRFAAAGLCQAAPDTHNHQLAPAGHAYSCCG